MSAFARMRDLLRSRPDTEHEVSINRIAIGFLVTLYWVISEVLGHASAADTMEHMLPIFIVFDTMTLGLFVHLLMHPGVSRARRVIALVLDNAALSYAMHGTNDAGGFLYPLYLWGTLGYGFRYGLRYMFVAIALSVVGFGAMTLTTPFWQAHPEISIGLTLGLVAIPAYSATLIRKLSAATRAAEEASRAKSMFLASVSHELRTPLNAIIGLSDLLTEARLGREEHEMARTIGRSGRSLASLINSILDVSRMEFGHARVKTEKIDLFSFLLDTRDMLSVQASAKSLRVMLHAAPGTPRNIVVNLNHLEEILVNLGGNAVKFTHEGHVLVSVAPVERTENGVRLRFEVRDTGIGIAHEARERIFERFAQADETIIDRYGGTGLGLAIVKQLVEGSGGKIGVDSSPGEGSTFWFELECGIIVEEEPATFTHQVFLMSSDPVARSKFSLACPQVRFFDSGPDTIREMNCISRSGADKPVIVLDSRFREFDLLRQQFAGMPGVETWPLVELRDLPTPADPVQSLFRTGIERDADGADILVALRVARALSIRDDDRLAPAASGGNLDILVAEDNRTNQLVIQKILENVGHRVTLASNGEQALEHIGSGHFDIVLMDINMPVINGIETAKLARFVELGEERLTIVALTADATPETRERCIDAGMDNCFTKPIEKEKLLAWLDQFQQSRARLTPRSQPQSGESREAAVARETAAAIDERALLDLEKLGGKKFVDQIVEQFVSDASGVLGEIARAVAAGDVHAFREQAHAMRSCAANVGANRVYDLCLEWRAVEARDVAINGEQYVRLLEGEFARVKSALSDRGG